VIIINQLKGIKEDDNIKKQFEDDNRFIKRISIIMDNLFSSIIKKWDFNPYYKKQLQKLISDKLQEH